MVELIYIRSKQKNIMVRNTNPTFQFEFKSEPIGMGKELADVLLKNPNFEIDDGAEYKGPEEFDLNGDGVFDHKDISMAGKVLARSKKNKKKKGD